MKSSANIIRQIKNNANSQLYLYCQPVSSAPPQDIPEVIKISKEYWSSKLIMKIDDSIISLSEWFSIPLKNIQKTLQNNPYGPLFISLNDFYSEELNVLFSNSKPVFKIQNDIDIVTKKWINNQN